MTKEEYLQKHNELIKKRDEINETYKVHYKEMQDNINALIKTYRPMGSDVNIYTNINSYGDITCEIAYIQKDGKDNFGSSFKLYLSKKYTHDTFNYEIELSHGTIGSYSKENIYQIYRLEHMLRIWKDIDYIQEELIKIATNKDYLSNEEEYKKITRDIDYLELEWIAQVREEIKNAMVIGKKYLQHTTPNDSYCWTITKITPQFVWYDYTFKIEDNERVFKDRKVRKQQMINYIYDGQLEPIQ